MPTGAVVVTIPAAARAQAAAYVAMFDAIAPDARALSRALSRALYRSVLRARSAGGWLASALRRLLLRIACRLRSQPCHAELDVLNNRPPPRGADPPAAAPRTLASAITRHGPPALVGAGQKAAMT